MEDNIYDIVKFRRQGVKSFFEIYENAAPSYVPLGRIPPFQIDLPAGVTMSGTKLIFRNYEGDFVDVIYFVNVSAESEMYTAGDVNKFIFFGKDITFADAQAEQGSPLLIPALTQGLHYFTIEDSAGNEWKSELMNITDCDLTRIKYRHTFADIGTYTTFQNLSTDFYYEIYVESEVARPEYEYDEDGTEDAVETFFADKQILEKFYVLEFPGQEHMVDAAESLRLHDDIVLTDCYGRDYQVEVVEVTQEWLNDDGWTAMIEVTFRAAKVVILGCGDSVSIGAGGGGGGTVTNPGTTNPNAVDLPSVFAYDDANAGAQGVDVFTPGPNLVPQKRHLYWQTIETDYGSAGCLTVRLS